MFKKSLFCFLFFCGFINAQYWGGKQNYWNTNNLYWNYGSLNWNNPYWQWSPVPSYNPYYNNLNKYPNVNFIYINPSVNYIDQKNQIKEDLGFRRP